MAYIIIANRDNTEHRGSRLQLFGLRPGPGRHINCDFVIIVVTDNIDHAATGETDLMPINGEPLKRAQLERISEMLAVRDEAVLVRSLCVAEKPDPCRHG
jgi:hypothetical protein